jgi:PDGF/VEGF domain
MLKIFCLIVLFVPVVYPQRADHSRHVLAYAHNRDVLSRVKCSVPVPTIVWLENVVGDPLTKYVPPVTIIHLCSNDGGCCFLPNMKCGPISTHQVPLHFLTTKAKAGRKNEMGFETLFATNHTACGCQPVIMFTSKNGGHSNMYSMH